MKRLKSKFSVISLALIMSLSLAACAPSQEPAQEAPQAPVESTETEQVEEADVVKTQQMHILLICLKTFTKLMKKNWLKK